MIYRKLLKSILISFLMIAALYLVSIRIYDPEHIFSNTEGLYTGNMRIQAKGYIDDTKKLDGIIIGSSMLANTSVSQCSRRLSKSADGTFLNLSLNGSAFSERKLVLDYALSKRRVDKVVYSLDMIPAHFVPLANMQWENLYDSNPFNDYLLYLNTRHLKCLFTFSKNEKCVGKKEEKDYPPEWITDPLYKNSFNGFCSWPVQSREILKDYLNEYTPSGLIKKYDLSYLKRNSRSNIFYLTDKYKETSFIFLIPPYSALYLKILEKNAISQIDWQNQYLRYFAKECDKRPNCELYGFNDMAFTKDIKNYKDLQHYSDRINSLMIESVSKGVNRITSSNIENYFLKAEKLYSSIDLQNVREELEHCGSGK